MVETMSTSTDNPFAPFTTSPDQRRAAFVQSDLCKRLVKGDAVRKIVDLDLLCRHLKGDVEEAAIPHGAFWREIALRQLLHKDHWTDEGAIAFLQKHIPPTEPRDHLVLDGTIEPIHLAALIANGSSSGQTILFHAGRACYAMIQVKTDGSWRLLSVWPQGQQHGSGGFTIYPVSPSSALYELVYPAFTEDDLSGARVRKALGEKLAQLIEATRPEIEVFYEEQVVAVSDDGCTIKTGDFVGVVNDTGASLVIAREELDGHKILIPPGCSTFKQNVIMSGLGSVDYMKWYLHRLLESGSIDPRRARLDIVVPMSREEKSPRMIVVHEQNVPPALVGRYRDRYQHPQSTRR